MSLRTNLSLRLTGLLLLVAPNRTADQLAGAIAESESFRPVLQAVARNRFTQRAGKVGV